MGRIFHLCCYCDNIAEDCTYVPINVSYLEPYVCDECEDKVFDLLTNNEKWGFGLVINKEMNFILNSIEELIEKRNSFPGLYAEYYILENDTKEALLDEEELDLKKELCDRYIRGEDFSIDKIKRSVEEWINQLRSCEYQWTAPLSLLTKFESNISNNLYRIQLQMTSVQAMIDEAKQVTNATSQKDIRDMLIQE